MPSKIRLNNTNQYYVGRLKTLTVDSGIYDVVVEVEGSSFVLYRNSGYVPRWEQMTNIGRTMNSYKAIITFEDQGIFMKVKMKTAALIATVFFNLFIIGISVFTIIENDYSWLFWCLLLMLNNMILRWELRKFKKFAPYFLNNL